MLELLHLQDKERASQSAAPLHTSAPITLWNRLVNLLDVFSLWLYKFTPWAFIVPRFYLAAGRSLPSSLQEVQAANVRAMLTYQPQTYAGKAIVFRASEQPPGCFPDATLGWSKVITGELDLYEIPGYHGEFLLYDRASLKVLGKQLRQCLNQAQGSEAAIQNK